MGSEAPRRFGICTGGEVHANHQESAVAALLRRRTPCTERDEPRKSSWKSGLGHRSVGQGAQSGVALIITLILLSVITFMAVTFLVVSRAEKGAVGTVTDLAVAREAANAALERAKAEVLASALASTNAGNIDLLVSTNFNNPLGFQLNFYNFTNVSYTLPNGLPLNSPDALYQNLSHLLYNPRPPVFVTNRASGANEFRYFLDLNRNARYDTNGLQPVMNPFGGFYDTNFLPLSQPRPFRTLSNFFVGDPEWIGRLERADLPHSPTNKFLYRYAYLVVPSSKTIDLNYIHNHAGDGNDRLVPGGGGRFIRNQGLGTWEMNLAGFLTDLNTNYWPYPRSTVVGTPYEYIYQGIGQVLNRGAAFDDAHSLVRYRYDANKLNLFSVAQLFDVPGEAAFRFDMLDGYTRGPIFTNSTLPLLIDPDQNQVTRPWTGSDNHQHFFTTQDLYDKAKTARSIPSGITFSDRLRWAGTNTDSYNRYTFYRMLSQLGTDTPYEAIGNKIHLNYDNATQGVQHPVTRQVVVSPTNFIPWRPIDFFTNAANRLLQNAGYITTNNGNNPSYVNINHIQIYPTNFYSPSIHQNLQLAANIHDATTGFAQNPGRGVPYPPSVFKPFFRTEPGTGGTNVIYIAGYEEVTNATAQVINAPLVDLEMPNPVLAPNCLVYGVPLVVGARKGFPNFNELSMQTEVQIARKLEFRRLGLNQPVNETNVMYTLSISNSLGLEAWNSYSNTFPRNLQLHARVHLFASLTNESNQVLHLWDGTVNAIQPFVGLAGGVFDPTRGTFRVAITNIPANSWLGYTEAQPARSFRVPLSPFGNNVFPFLQNSVYHAQTARFLPLIFNANPPFERLNRAYFPAPRWWLNLKSRVQFFLVDDRNLVVDAVNLMSTEPPVDIAGILGMDGNCGSTQDGLEGSMWCTNRWRGIGDTSPTYGMLNQIAAGLGIAPVDLWNNHPQTINPKEASIDFFRAQFGLSPRHFPQGTFSKTNVFYTPYVATRTIYLTTQLQANDPLVHYTLGDLRTLDHNFQTNRISFHNPALTNNIGQINGRYEPWLYPGAQASTSTNLALKDPMVTRSDDWDFPTNKLANVGALGRVHRGTPWQTIYLKSPTNSLPAWQAWSGNGEMVRNSGQLQPTLVGFNRDVQDAWFTHPIHDRYIVDLFTTALNENATRGQMSVNQTNLAAWSALLSGVNVMPNFTNSMTITPAGTYNAFTLPPLVQIVGGVQRTLTNFPGQAFYRLGDILATPELTVSSPFLKSNDPLLLTDLSDAVYERIPQQVLGLMKGAEQPRFVVYAYGQTLKPADRSLVAGGAYSGLCTNYQVVAEVATRSVIRIDGTPMHPQPLVPQAHLNNLRVVTESFNVLPPD